MAVFFVKDMYPRFIIQGGKERDGSLLLDLLS